MVSNRGQAVLISLHNDPGASRGQDAPVARFEWRRPLHQCNGKNGVHFARHTILLFLLRGLSSAGRAPDLHSGGQEFDPPRLHQVRVGSSGG